MKERKMKEEQANEQIKTRLTITNGVEVGQHLELPHIAAVTLDHSFIASYAVKHTLSHMTQQALPKGFPLWEFKLPL